MWFMKMNNSEKMDPNINFAVICNKQDLFLIIPIYNERKKTPTELRDSSGEIAANLSHLLT